MESAQSVQPRDRCILARMNEPSPWFLTVGILVAFPVLFVGIWSFVCVLLATMSGWSGMATRFKAPPDLRGVPLPSGWASRIGFVSYRGTLSFEATPQGLIARVMRLFPFHPPLLLPWRARALARGGGVFTAGTMTVEGGATFSLNETAFQSIERALNTGAATPFPRV